LILSTGDVRQLPHLRLDCERPNVGAGGGAAKRLAVSTGRLSASPHLYVRPIDPVVFREPSPIRLET
jgi:hypothetical protein